MGVFDTFDINASGMSAERYRMDIISQNVANAETTRTEDGTPYVRKVVTFQEKQDTTNRKFSHMLDTAFSNLSGRPLGCTNSAELTTAGKGVKVGGVYEDTWTESNMVSHPDADENGYVTYPNVNTITEMTNLIDASRGYEANETAFEASKAIALKGLAGLSQ